MPETQMIDQMLLDAPQRVETMNKTVRTTLPASAVPFVPARRELPVLAAAVATCRGCSIYCNATQAVFGEGPADAKCMFIGEQPGDQEDGAGRPFVGPAGQVLNAALVEAGISRDEIYLTNAVKHFKWEPRGTRRIHARPSAREINACRPWLEAQIETIKPRMIVCLGVAAAQSLLGAGFRLHRQRGVVMTDKPWAPWLLATIHPSFLLRISDPVLQQNERAAFIRDLRMAADAMAIGRYAP